MPIRVIKNLPAARELARENIFVMDGARALTQQIRPIRIVIVNLMPTKTATELQLLRVLANTPLQLDVSFVRTATHRAKNASAAHLTAFYKTFEDIRDGSYDGMIVTGAPVEALPFERVDYWPELVEILEWSQTHVFSSFHICWGAQAALYQRYGIDKVPLTAKLSGIYEHRVTRPYDKLLTGFDEVFRMPHSRHTTITHESIAQHPELEVLAESQEAGIAIVKSRDNKDIYVFGHAEYDAETLASEYQRDLAQGLKPELPRHYYPEDDPARRPTNRWRACATLLYTNWLNYYVYQETPYDIASLMTGEKNDH